VNRRESGCANERIHLRPTASDDLDDLRRLWNDGRVMKWVGSPDGLGYDSDAMARWLERLQASPNRQHFVVISSEAGFCGEAYYAVDPMHRRAGLDIKIRPEAQGRGVASTALAALIDRVFSSTAEVESVWTEPSEVNVAARKLYWRCGLLINSEKYKNFKDSKGKSALPYLLVFETGGQ